MKKRLFYPALLLAGLSFFFQSASAQCPGGFTQAQINWDNLEYFFNSGSSAPYLSYINDAREMSQRFGIGTNWVTIATSSNALVNPGTGAAVSAENTTHTGDVPGFTGADVQYNPTTNGQTITLTFNAEVRNLRFTLYDVDRLQQINFSALNAASVAQNINVATYNTSGATILTINNNNTTTANIVAANTAIGNASNQATATVTIAGPVRTVTLTVATVGTDAVFWLSDIDACVSGSFPSNWHQGFSTRPFVGPTQNQPDYFLVTPDNNSCYMMNPVTGQCYWLFTDAARTYMNSFAYDAQNKFLYYISENVGLDASNRSLKRYDFNTETISTVIANISTTLNIPTFNGGVESGGAAFYDGKLYFGIEGGESTGAQRESMIWAIDLATNTSFQVYSTPAYNGTSIIHDWADFIVRDGEIINFNSSRTGSSAPYTYPNSSVTHVNMMTGVATRYNNPTPAVFYAGQAGMTWSGNVYSIYSIVQPYNLSGGMGAGVAATVVNVPGEPIPPPWAGSAGDASEAFRPKCDFGDAPASYDPYADPATQSPAVHERSELIRLGATWTREFWKRGTGSTEDSDDGLAYTPFLPPGAVGSAYADVTVFNNSGANATLIAWLDFNGNGLFDASEAITPITVPSSASNQNFHLFWPSTPNTFSLGDSTYMRIRITAASAGMTASHATGYFTNGEVEDYKVYVDNFPLTTHFMQFEALAAGKKALLNWKVAETSGTRLYQIERSPDNRVWSPLAQVPATGLSGTAEYQYQDPGLSGGTYYYRIIQLDAVARPRYSEVRKVSVFDPQQAMRVYPNPAREQVNLEIYLSADQPVTLSLVSQSGVIQLTRVYGARSGINRLPLDLPVGLPMGWYILRVNYADVSLQQKILISK